MPKPEPPSLFFSGREACNIGLCCDAVLLLCCAILDSQENKTRLYSQITNTVKKGNTNVEIKLIPAGENKSGVMNFWWRGVSDMLLFFVVFFRPNLVPPLVNAAICAEPKESTVARFCTNY